MWPAEMRRWLFVWHGDPFPGNKRWAVLRELVGVELREQVKGTLENLLGEGKG